MPTLADMGLDEGGNILGKSFNTLPNLGNAPVTRGRMTWFNPYPYNYTDPATGRAWNDTGARKLREGPHASGLPITTPGFASSNRQTLGHWHEVTLPDGRKYITQQTDIGPPGVVDLNGALASQAYPGGQDTMTGRTATTRYIGAKLPEGVQPGPAAGGGWNTSVSADAGAPGGAGYVNPAIVAQGGATNPADLVRKDDKSLAQTIGDYFSELQFKPAKPTAPAPTGFGAGQPYRFAAVGQRR
jgi:hypothetical protein